VKRLRLLPVLALGPALAACVGGLRSNAPPIASYVLRAAPAPAAGAPQGIAASLRVLQPTAAPGFGSDRILILSSDGHLDFYAASRWAASLPAVVEQLAVETLRRAGPWRTVEGSRGAFPTDYVLDIRIRRFDADYGSDSAGGSAAPLVHVALDCSVGRSSGRELIASFSAERTVAAEHNRLGAVVAAFQRAADEALAEIDARATAAVNSSRAPSPP